MNRFCALFAWLFAAAFANGLSADNLLFEVSIQTRGEANWERTFAAASHEPSITKLAIEELCKKGVPGVQSLPEKEPPHIGFVLNGNVVAIDDAPFLSNYEHDHATISVGVNRWSNDSQGAAVVKELIPLLCARYQEAVNARLTREWEASRESDSFRLKTAGDELGNTKTEIDSIGNSIQELSPLGVLDEKAAAELLLESHRNLESAKLEQARLKSRSHALQNQMLLLQSRATHGVANDEIVQILERVVRNREAIASMPQSRNKLDQIEVETALARAQLELAQAKRQATQGAQQLIEKFSAELAENEIDLAEIEERLQYLSEREERTAKLAQRMVRLVGSLRREQAALIRREEKLLDEIANIRDSLNYYSDAHKPSVSIDAVPGKFSFHGVQTGR